MTEPSLEDTKTLIQALEKFAEVGIKTLRETYQGPSGMPVKTGGKVRVAY